ncbi:MAG: phosphoribosylanthranilate isomerase [Flavobacterium sp.]|nr:MAG: phosphoribosylanthranilate isomerase [Flavobacterium sp.]
MKHNVSAVASLQPDYLGFIFYDKSPRHFSGEVPHLPPGVRKVGVFVNASLEDISEKIKQYQLDVIQLHGEETPQFCKQLRKANFQSQYGLASIWKVFGIQDGFNFTQLAPYEGYVDRFLFDTAGKAKGGNGYPFNWDILGEYPSVTPLVLSGGIGLAEIPRIKAILKTSIPLAALDINSRFEIEPGLKDIEKIKRFTHELSR